MHTRRRRLSLRRNDIESTALLIFRRHLNMIDDKRLNRTFRRLELKPKLFLKSSKD